MKARLKAMGIEIPEAFLPPQEAAQPVGRAHLARALIAMGVVNTMDQAFGRFLGAGKPAYVPSDHMSATQAVALLRKAHCVPVLAHPAKLPMEGQALFSFIHALAKEGLLGLEVFHPSASRRAIRELEAFARTAGLLVTGGSDFHGDHASHVRIGGLPGHWARANQDVSALLSAITNA